MSKVRRADVVAAGRSLYLGIAICAAVFVLVHIAPKNPASRNTMRLVYTIAFFASTISLCWFMTGPRSRYLDLVYRWRYENSPPSIDRAWRRYLVSLDRLVNIVAYLSLTLLATTATLVLNFWFQWLSSIDGLCNTLWWVSFLMLLLSPFAGNFMLIDLLNRRKELREQVKLSNWYKPRAIESVYRPEVAVQSAEPVTIHGDGAFRAGGQDWHWDDFTQNCIVFGQPGSGKTLCVLNALVDGVLRSTMGYTEPPGGLILDRKGAFRGKIESLCERAGRERDLLILDPTNPAQSIRWNPLDTDNEVDSADRFIITLHSLGIAGDQPRVTETLYSFMSHAISLVRLTQPHCPPTFRHIGELASSVEAVVELTDRFDVSDPACDTTLSYFANEWASTSKKHRAEVHSQLERVAHEFEVEPYSTVFSGHSTMRIADIIRTGKILYANIAVAHRALSADLLCTLVKLEYFRQVLGNTGKTRPSFFVCDDFHDCYTATQDYSDADFLARSRANNHANILVAPSIPAIPRQARDRNSTQMLANCAVKIFLRNTDRETNEFASSLFGSNGSSTGAALSDSNSNAAVPNCSDCVVPTERFTELVVPVRRHNINYCESITHIASADVTHAPRKQQWGLHPIVSM